MQIGIDEEVEVAVEIEKLEVYECHLSLVLPLPGFYVRVLSR
jgi:hypothetical protein